MLSVVVVATLGLVGGMRLDLRRHEGVWLATGEQTCEWFRPT